MGELGSDGRRCAVTEHSPIVRAAQFGVSERDCQVSAAVGEAAYDGYCASLVPAVQQHYETVVAAIFDRYFVSDSTCGWPPAAPTSKDRELSTYEDLARYLSLTKCGLPTARKADEITADGPTNMVLAIEGMDFVQSETQIAPLLEAGARVFALQYNKPNALTRGNCTQADPSSASGLTELGKRVVMRLFASGAILDLAHSAPGTRSDVLDFATEQGYGGQVAYTHGAILEDAAPERVVRLPGRFLCRREAQRIIGLGGIIGLTPALLFTPSLSHFAEQISRLRDENENGATGIALGTDFGGISAGSLLPEVRSVADLKRIGDVLEGRHGFTDSDINALLRTNATAWLQRALPMEKNAPLSN
jgi:microsomal dipeptidase-like Zn-dependent dipeptidase